VDVVILALQMTMLAVTATTAAEGGSRNVAATSSSMELDRAERGEGEAEAEAEGEAGTPDEDVEERGLMESDVIDEEDKLVVVNVGVVETIKRLWDSEEPIVRRFR
jgi:hypothetical protein